MAVRHTYEALLHLYPLPYRALFGREMAAVFEQVTRDYKPRGILVYSMFVGGEFAGLIAGAFSVWSDEYLRKTARGRWLSTPTVIAAIAALAVTAFLQNSVYKAMMGHRPPHLPPPVQSQTPLQLVGLMTLIGMCLILVSVLSMAFVWNMRTIGNRSGRLKPVWMPGRNNARTSKRDQTLHRNSGRQRRELHRPAR